METLASFERSCADHWYGERSRRLRQRSFELLRTLSQRLDVVREEERTRIARELHDELGVRMTCMKMDLSRLVAMMRESLFPREKMEEKIRAMSADVDTTIAEVQRLAAELRPGVLDDLGLVAAIEWQCQDFERRSGIRCLCEASFDEIKSVLRVPRRRSGFARRRSLMWHATPRRRLSEYW